MQPQPSSFHYSLQWLFSKQQKSSPNPCPSLQFFPLCFSGNRQAQHAIGAAEHLAHHWELQLKSIIYSYGRMAKRAKHQMRGKGLENILTKGLSLTTWQSNDNQTEPWEMSFLLQPERSHTSQHIQINITQSSTFGGQLWRHGRSLPVQHTLCLDAFCPWWHTLAKPVRSFPAFVALEKTFT